MRSEGLRNYGLPESGVDGIPKATATEGVACPNCGCEEVMDITVTPTGPLVSLVMGDSHQGSYMGCPACPWASPMVIMQAPQQAE